MVLRGFIVILWGICILAGGIMGYTQANSLASLFMGTGCAAVALISGRGMMKRNEGGRAAALVLAGLLLIFFGSRFYRSGVFMPAGLMSLLSIFILTTLSTGYNTAKEKKA